ncbi:MAG: ketoacyl-ACP synthase III [Anaerolineae bacterium]|nr:ketoacyl-ACP synthase III [Anaerolineae bacterium]
MTERYARLTGWGRYVPEKRLTNVDLEKMVETSDEWITQRTGIKERRIRGEKDTNTSMAVAAGQEALKVAGISAQDLDFIIVCTSSPDYLLPSAGSLVQDALGADCGAVQVTAGCSGWVYGAVMADALIRAGVHNAILVIGVEIVSYGIDYTDRKTCVLFGDAAAATVFQASDQPSGILASELGSDGAKAQALWVPGGGSAWPISPEVVEQRQHYIQMDGPEVFKFASRVVGSSLKRTIAQAGLLPEDIDLFIPHQANARIIEAGARFMRQPIEKFYMNLQYYGNTSAASVPLALVEAIEEGRLKDGCKVAMVAFGAGLTWGSVVIQMGVGEVSPAHVLFSAGRARYLAKRARETVLDTAQAAWCPFIPGLIRGGVPSAVRFALKILIKHLCAT